MNKYVVLHRYRFHHSPYSYPELVKIVGESQIVYVLRHPKLEDTVMDVEFIWGDEEEYYVEFPDDETAILWFKLNY